MKIAFYSNFLSSHQSPLCNALYDKEGCEFRFIASRSLSETRKAMGWGEEVTPYVIESFKNDESYQEALSFVKDADVLLYGSDEETEFFRIAVKSKKTVIFRLSERVYRKGRWRAISPRGLKRRWDTYYKYPKKNVYLLCASAYAAGDYALLVSYIGRCYKWGYFTKVDTLDSAAVMSKKESGSIFWAGRLLQCKHPELLLQVAEHLRQKHLPFKIKVAGDGPLREELQKQIDARNLSNYICLLGILSQEETHQHMQKAEIYVATSDYEEGWGAVINEAMSRCCAVVACDAMGAVPFLIKEGENGFSYRYGDNQKLCHSVEQLLLNSNLRHQLGTAAYQTMQNLWNPAVAAERLYQLAKAKIENTEISFTNGPCSKARIFRKER